MSSYSALSPINCTFMYLFKEAWFLLKCLEMYFIGQKDEFFFHLVWTCVFHRYGESTEASKGKRGHWRAVQHCTNIVRTWCDLSLETWDEEKGYLARVRALGRKSSSKWTLTKRRFDPKWDSKYNTDLSYTFLMKLLFFAWLQ